ncbi:beta-lactamase family protein [Paenibacillus sp. TRM 82003]|nr:beta-lactamase family protein [Paenibacillus sp. TRM 82003]
MNTIARRYLFFFIIMLLLALPLAGTRAASEGPVDEGKLQRIGAYVNEQFVQAGIPGGAVAIVYRNETVLAKGIGYADVASEREATADTVYATSSVTKPLTAAAILQLAHSDRIDLDAKVTAYLPWFRYKDAASSQVTVRDLLTHSAGVNRFSADGAIYRDIDNNRNSKEHAARTLRFVEMNSAPGIKGQYCNTCYNLLGLIIEQVTGKPYETYMHQELFRPLGMDATAFHPDQLPDADVAKEYGYLFGFPVEARPYWAEFGSSQAPEGGAYSSAADLARFVSATLGYGMVPFFTSGTILEHNRKGVPASDLSNTVYTEGGFESSAFGGTPIFSKPGDGMGSSAEIVLIPSQQTGIVLLVGEADGEACGRIAKGIVSLLLDQPPESVKGMPNFIQLLGWISLAILVFGAVLLLGLI